MSVVGTAGRGALVWSGWVVRRVWLFLLWASGRSPGMRRRGLGRSASLRARLVVLVLLPLLGLVVSTGALVARQGEEARAAATAVEAVSTAEQVSAARGALVAEKLASLAHSRLLDPTGPADVAPAVEAAVAAELGDEELADARVRTDAALAVVGGGTAVGEAAGAVAADLQPVRASVVRSVEWSVLAPAFESLSDRLLLAERRAIDDAVAAGVEGQVVEAVLEAGTASEAVAVGGQEAAALLDALLHGSTASDGSARGDERTAAVVEALTASPTAGVRVRSETLLEALAALPGPDEASGLGAPEVRDATSRLVGTQAGLRALAEAANRAAEELATTTSEQAQADAAASAIGGVVLLALTGAAVLRTSSWLTRPLKDLAEQAEHVSRGALVPVRTDGPQEVRTVAEGLAATVASLGRLQEQARAVCAGDLGSPLLVRPLPGPLGEVVHASVTGMVQAMVDRDRLREDLVHRATHDPLTELPNRAHAMDLLDSALARSGAAGTPVGVLFVDLDRFKRVNDTLGHAAGDELLRVVARRLRASLPPGAAVCRLGGDEFLIVVEHADERALVLVAERLLDAVAQPVVLDAATTAVGASVGVALSCGQLADRETLLAEADTAAYRVKAGGRGGVGLYDDALRAQLLATRELEEALAIGISRGELHLHYQAIAAVDDGRVIGYEALVRWDRPGHGLLPPSAFVDVAEGSTLVCDLGREVLHQATRQLVQWSAADPTAATRNLGVNISGRHLASTRVVDDVRDALHACGLAPHRLVLEITETVLVDHETALERLAELRGLGVSVAIDDFGTGFTSIAQLRRMPADILKIDRSLAGSPDPADQHLVRLVLGAARAAGLEVVAEGVETSAQMDALREAGCDAVQGYWLHRPEPPGARAPELPATTTTGSDIPQMRQLTPPRSALV